MTDLDKLIKTQQDIYIKNKSYDDDGFYNNYGYPVSAITPKCLRGVDLQKLYKGKKFTEFYQDELTPTPHTTPIKKESYLSVYLLMAFGICVTTLFIYGVYLSYNRFILIW